MHGVCGRPWDLLLSQRNATRQLWETWDNRFPTIVLILLLDDFGSHGFHHYRYQQMSSNMMEEQKEKLLQGYSSDSPHDHDHENSTYTTSPPSPWSRLRRYLISSQPLCAALLYFLGTLLFFSGTVLLRNRPRVSITPDAQLVYCKYS